MTQPSVSQQSTYARSEVSFTRGGEPSYEIGIAHGGPLIDDVLGFRASVWYRYDGGWLDRVDPTTQAVLDKNANRADTVAARLAFLIQPNDALSIAQHHVSEFAQARRIELLARDSNVAAGSSTTDPSAFRCRTVLPAGDQDRRRHRQDAADF
jgi:hypothetical protein